MDQALSLVQRHHLSLQSMQKWLDSAAALLQRVTTGVELENQADCAQDLEEILAKEKNFKAGLQEFGTLDPLLVDFLEAGVMSGLREKVNTMQLRRTKVQQQVDTYREVLERCVLYQVYIYSLYLFHIPKMMLCIVSLLCHPSLMFNLNVS